MNKFIISFVLLAIVFIFSNTIRSKVGLQNLGNTCYMNAVLQCLFACQPLQDALREASRKKILARNPFGQEYYALAQQHQVLQQGSVWPTGFLQCGRVGEYGTQQDAQEFLSKFIDNIGAFQVDRQNPAIKAVSDPAADIFYFKVRTYLERLDGKVEDSQIWQNICTLNFPDPAKVKQISLVDLFKEFYATEILEDNPVIKSKWAILSSVPEVFLVHLSRFAYDKNTFRPSKIFTQVQYDMNPFKVQAEDGVRNYRLFGCVIHQGVYGAGHYVSVVRYGDQWYFCDDDRVTSINQNQARGYIEGRDGSINGQSYVFFFEQIGAKRPSADLNTLFNNFTKKIQELYIPVKGLQKRFI